MSGETTDTPHGDHCHKRTEDGCKCADYYFMKIVDRCSFEIEVDFAYDMWFGCHVKCEHGSWDGASYGLCGGLAQSIQHAWERMDAEHPKVEQ